MNAAIEEQNTFNAPDLCTVVVIYDDDTTRARALKACDYFIRQDWENVELDFHWWRTDFLKDPYMAEAAAHHAIVSDILIVCSREAGQISPTLEAWFESWIGKRKTHEGAFIDLAVIEFASGQLPGRQNVFREIARRGGFDYLTTVPEQPELDAFRSAETPPTTSTRHDLLDRSRPSSHHGLNE